MSKRRPFLAFVQEYGREYPAPPLLYLEDDRWQGRSFARAATLALSDLQYTYVEGYIGDDLWLPHAWVVDDCGDVIEGELSPPQNIETQMLQERYFGVPFRTEWLKRVVEEHHEFRMDSSDPDDLEAKLRFPSLAYLVFDRLGWRALAAGVMKP
jgi:hypothetical protein